MMIKTLFITNRIPHYRIPLYEALGKKCELLIGHCGKEVEAEAFDQLILREKKIGPFFRYEGDFDHNAFDVIVVNGNLRLLNLYRLVFQYKKPFKIVMFGIGVSASYDKKYDRDKLAGRLFKYLISKADAAIFYDFYPVIKYSSMGVTPGKMFVAPNTVTGNVEDILPLRERDSILFIGSLYRQKGIFVLLDAYRQNVEAGKVMPMLNIIGDGPERAAVETWVRDSDLSESINIVGAKIKEEDVRPFLERALVCVSPHQAGLSVQKAFSYGVPYVTSNYPFSGGEFTSIIEGVTGFYFDGTVDGLASKLVEILEHPDLEKIFRNCREFYVRFRSPTNWVDGFVRAIESVCREQAS